MSAELEMLEFEIKNCQAMDKCRFYKEWCELEVKLYGTSGVIPPQWGYWFKNRMPCTQEKYYTTFKFNPNVAGSNAKIVFISMRPTTHPFPTKADVMFGRILTELGLAREVYTWKKNVFVLYESVFVTDMIKCRGIAGNHPKSLSEMEQQSKTCVEFFKKELQIVKKIVGEKLVAIALGNDAYNILQELQGKSEFSNILKATFKISHSSRWRSFSASKERLKKLLEKIK